MTATIELKEKFVKIFKEVTNVKNDSEIDTMFHLIQEIAKNALTDSPTKESETLLIESVWEDFFNYQEEFDKGAKEKYFLVQEFGEKVFNQLLTFRFINEDGSYARTEHASSNITHLLLSALSLKKLDDFFEYGKSVLNDLTSIFRNMDESEEYVMKKLQTLTQPYLERYEKAKTQPHNDEFVEIFASLGHVVLNLLERFDFISTRYVIFKDIERTENEEIEEILQVLSDIREELNPNIGKLDDANKMNFLSFGCRIFNILAKTDLSELTNRIPIETALVKNTWELYQKHRSNVRKNESKEYDLIKEFGKDILNQLVDFHFISEDGTLQKYHLFAQSELLQHILTGITEESPDDYHGYGVAALHSLTKFDDKTRKSESEVMDKIEECAESLLNMTTKDNLDEMVNKKIGSVEDLGSNTADYLMEQNFIDENYLPIKPVETIQNESLKKMMISLLEIRKEYNGPLEESSDKCEGFNYWYFGTDVLTILLNIQHQHRIEEIQKKMKTYGNIHVPIERLAEEVKTINYDNEEQITVVSEAVMDRILLGRLYDFEICWMNSNELKKYIKKDVSLEEIDTLKSTEKGGEQLIQLVGKNIPNLFDRISYILFDMACEPYGIAMLEIDGVKYYAMNEFEDFFYVENQ